MKALSNQGFLLTQLSFFILTIISCASPATSLRHGNDFTNIRSEVVLNNGNSILGYASYQGESNDGQVTLYMPAERKEVKISLDDIEKLKVEDHEYVVKKLISPYNARKNGAATTTKAIVRRMGMEKDPVQVFEYKYPVKNPKSPLNSIETAWFVSFPDDVSNRPLVQMGSPDYKAKWNEFVFEMQKQNVTIQAKVPSTPKILMENMKDIPVTISGQEDFATPGS